MFLVYHFNFFFIPCGRLSWLPVSFLLHIKYTLSYHFISYCTNHSGFFRDAMHKRGLCRHAVCVCLCVCLSVMFVSCAKTNKDSFKVYSPSGSDTILVFPSQRGCRYCDDIAPNGGVECKGVCDKMRLFTNISLYISETVIVRWADAARLFVSIEFSFHPYDI